MNDAALKILIDSLEAHRSSLDAWLSFWTWLVVIGIVFDVLFVIHAYQGDLHEWRRGIVSPPSRPSRRWYVFELFAVVLVALGVAGELAVEGTIGRVETQIRTANDQRASLLQQEAGDAKESSKSAADAAARAKNEADAVGKVADQAQAKIASVGKRAGQLDAQVGMTQYLLSARRVQDGTALANALRPDFKGRSVFLTSYAGVQQDLGEVWTASGRPVGVVIIRPLLGTVVCLIDSIRDRYHSFSVKLGWVVVHIFQVNEYEFSRLYSIVHTDKFLTQRLECIPVYFCLMHQVGIYDTKDVAFAKLKVSHFTIVHVLHLLPSTAVNEVG